MGMFDDEDKPVTQKVIVKEEVPVEEFYTDKQIEEESDLRVIETGKICSLVYGADGTGKSGIVLSYIKNLKPDERMFIIDMDGGNLPILETHWKEAVSKGQIKWLNPIVMTKDDVKKEVKIDYIQTFTKVKAAVNYVRNNYKEKNIKAIVFDGLSTLLEYAEKQMRIDRNLTPDGGVTTAYWKVRAARFREIIEVIKSIPIARFFIAHEDFIIPTDGKIAMIKNETNRTMWQKIETKRTAMGGEVEYTATIDKSKYKPQSEGRQTIFLKVEDNKYDWTGEEIWEQLE